MASYSDLYDITKWMEVNEDGIVLPKKKYKNKNLKDIVLECKRISIKPALYLLQKS